MALIYVDLQNIHLHTKRTKLLHKIKQKILAAWHHMAEPELV